MAKKVYKYTLPVVDNWSQHMQAGAEILYVGNQYESLCVWALVEPGAPPVARHFRIAGTGHPIDEPDLKYLGSAQFAGGALIFHVFEVTQ